MLNGLPRGSRKLFGETVIRRDDAKDLWWIMNKPDKGWGEFGFAYNSLGALFREWNVLVVDFAKDTHSFFYRVVPGKEKC